MTAGVDELGVSFGSGATAEAFHVDPVPRVMDAAEWELVERGLAQRVRALSAFTADVYGDRAIVAAGVVPERAIETSVYFEPWMIGVEVPAWAYTAVAGMDLVRGSDGLLAVLEDNLRTPSGLTYASAARTAVDGAPPGPAAGRAAPAGPGLRGAGGGAARGGAGRRRRAVRGAALRRPGEQRLVRAPHAGQRAWACRS